MVNEIKRNPENYDDMMKKLRQRHEEEEEAVRKRLETVGAADLLSDPEAIEMARKELEQRSNRREYTSLSAAEKETKVNPADPHVLELKNKVNELSSAINTQFAQSTDPKVQQALLKGRVTVGGVKPTSNARG